MKCKYCKKDAHCQPFYLEDGRKTINYINLCYKHWHDIYAIKTPNYIPDKQNYTYKVKQYEKSILYSS